MAIDLDRLKQNYDADGYVVLERFLPDDLLQDLKAETDRFVAAARSRSLVGSHFDVVEGPDGRPDLRRVTDPQEVSPAYDKAMRFEPLIDVVSHLLGSGVRFDHGKLNFKPPAGSGALDWHQDFAFYPQTNDDMLAVGVLIEDCGPENGPLMVIPGSHKKPMWDHHQGGVFVGGVKAADLGAEVEKAVALTAPAGSITIHHCRTLHGSTENRGRTNRPLMLFNYFAADAFPIFHGYDWDEFNGRLLRGAVVTVPRVVPLACKVPYPAPKPSGRYSTGSIYDLQEELVGGAILT